MTNNKTVNEVTNIIEKFPNLSVIINEGNWIVLEGILDITAQDSFQVKIEYDTTNGQFPKLFELGNKIPKKLTRHIYTQDNSCCITVPEMQAILLNQGLTLLDFIEKHAIPYFANQLYYEENGVYANGEYSHGSKGIIEFYQDILKTKDKILILKIIKHIFDGNLPSTKQNCLCKKGKKFRDCHQKAVLLLSNISKQKLFIDYKQIENYEFRKL